jgi:hypothetical protein
VQRFELLVEWFDARLKDIDVSATPQGVDDGVNR